MSDRTMKGIADTLPGVEAAQCLDEDEVLAFAEGQRMIPSERARIEQHIDLCTSCLELVLEVVRDFRGSGAAWVASERHVFATTLVPGSLISGRFHVQRFVARGGMGEVYEA